MAALFGSRAPRLGVTATVTATVAAAVVALAACSGASGGSTPTAGPATAGSPPAASSPAPSTGATEGATPGAPAAGGRTPTTFAYQPLFPFATQAEAAAWQRGQNAGHQPWHLDPAATALAFTAYLGLTGITKTAKTVVTGDDAHVTVGYTDPEGSVKRVFPAAVVHLVRFGTGTNAPWEVVGTDDSTFTLTTPRYGARAGSSVTVGGRITGVDENIRVQVFGPKSNKPLGVACCVPAGGNGSPWQTSVRIAPATGDVLTILATTGGHLVAVERFAVTGVRRS